MGKGDKRTRRGKIFAGSYGKTRQKPHTPAFVPSEKPAVSAAPAVKEKPKAKVKKKAAVAEEPAPEVAAEASPEVAVETPEPEVAAESPAEETPVGNSEAEAEEKKEAATE